jgi:hypothetical protein
MLNKIIYFLIQVANTYPDQRFPQGYIAELWLLDVYKGADKLAGSLGLTLAQDDDTAKLRDRLDDN